jgi:pyruvate ferredoxin oxidoreductase beta subunit
VRVVAQGGDGGTTDIGFGCLSGMFERNDDVLYICYDNEAYMNTGVQRSARRRRRRAPRPPRPSAPSPATSFGQGKNLPLIAMAHDIPYVATATVADLHDLERKVERRWPARRALPPHPRALPARLGLGLQATRSSSRGWPSRDGLFPVFEAEHGEVTGVSKIRRRCPVEDYLRRSAASRTCSARAPARRRSRASRRSPTATSRASACWTTRSRRGRGLKAHEQAVRHHARRRLEPRQPHRLVARRAPRLRRPAAAVQPRCPAGENIQGGSITPSRRLRGGLAQLVRTTPPGVMGRVCYHPCETRLQPRQLDEAVGINGRALPRRRGDRRAGVRPPRAPTGKRVLVVGAGPSGSSAAYHLRALGPRR